MFYLGCREASFQQSYICEKTTIKKRMIHRGAFNSIKCDQAHNRTRSVTFTLVSASIHFREILTIQQIQSVNDHALHRYHSQGICNGYRNGISEIK